jgi:hypothetical protein
MTAGNDIEDRLTCSATAATAGPAYTMTARVLHWATAFLVLSVIPLGIVAANDWGGSMQNAIFASEQRSFPSSFFGLSIGGHTHHCRYLMTSPNFNDLPRTPRTGASTFC